MEEDWVGPPSEVEPDDGVGLKHHCGTDMQIASWFFVIGSVIYVSKVRSHPLTLIGRVMLVGEWTRGV